jgi:hypothetical protein
MSGDSGFPPRPRQSSKDFPGRSNPDEVISERMLLNLCATDMVDENRREPGNSGIVACVDLFGVRDIELNRLRRPVRRDDHDICGTRHDVSCAHV